MVNDVNASKPMAVTGEAVFTSYDGLRVEANGKIGFLTFESKPLEMRSGQIMSALLPVSQSKSSIFVEVLLVGNEKLWLIGLLSKISDFNRRPGVMGACVSLTGEERDLSGIGVYLYDYLFPIIEDAVNERWAGKPLPERLNLIQGVPPRETAVRFKMKSATELLHRVPSSEVTAEDVIQASFKLIECSPEIGRIVISPEPTKATKPADTQFLSAVNSAYAEAQEREQFRRQASTAEQTRNRPSEASADNVENLVRNLLQQEAQTEAAEEKVLPTKSRAPKLPNSRPPKSMEEVLRRQEIIGQRLTRIEKTLDTVQAQTVKREMPIDKAFAMKKPQPDRLSSIVFLVGVGLTAVLILLIVAWLFLTGEAVEGVEPISGPDPTVSEQTLNNGASQPTSENIIADCSNPRTLAEQTFCDKRQQE